MSVVVVATAFPLPEHRAEAVAAFEAAIIQLTGLDSRLVSLGVA